MSMIVIPNQPCALSIGIVIICLAREDRLIWHARNVSDIVEHAARAAQETFTAAPVWRPPAERSAVANPGHQTAVQVDRDPVLRVVGSRQSRINRDDVSIRKRIGHAQLCWRARS